MSSYVAWDQGKGWSEVVFTGPHPWDSRTYIIVAKPLPLLENFVGS
jgi:hypothetical protein